MKHEDLISIVKEQYERVTGNPPFQTSPTIENGHIVSVWVCEKPDSSGFARSVDIQTDSRFPRHQIRRAVEIYVEHMQSLQLEGLRVQKI